MRTIDRNKNEFESKLQLRRNVYFPVEARSDSQIINQQFVVPWQLEKTKERKVTVE